MKITNLTIFTISSSIQQFAAGLIGPFYVIFVQQIGGTIENLGIAFGVLGFFSSLATYFAGKHSDESGRKPLLILTGYLTSVLFLLYPFVETLLQLYVLQAIAGVVNSLFRIMASALLADITMLKRRGSQMGLYNAVVGILASFALIIGGFLIGSLGFNIVFYLFSGLTIISTTFLFLIKEKVRK